MLHGLACWFVDSRGLVVSSRTDLTENKRRFAHDAAPAADLLAAVEADPALPSLQVRLAAARFAAEPASLETGAHLAMALGKGGRLAEARLQLRHLLVRHQVRLQEVLDR